MEIKILGTGCKNCLLLEKNVRKVINELDIKSNIEVITDIDKILDYGVMMIPGLVINKKIFSSGKALSTTEIVGILKKIA